MAQDSGTGSGAAKRRREEEVRKAALLARYSATPPATIPSQGQQPKQGVPAPQTGPVPAPSIQYQVITDAQRMLGEPTPQPANIFQQLFASLKGPRTFQNQQQQGQFTQESLPVAGLLESGQTPSEFYGYETTQPTALEEAQRRAAEYNDPLNTIEAAAGHFYTGLQFGTRTPFVLFGVQERLGYTDEQMKSLGYMRTLAGWVRLPKGPKTATSGTVSPGSSRQTVYVGGGGGGGGSRYTSTPGSSLINWRI